MTNIATTSWVAPYGRPSSIFEERRNLGNTTEKPKMN
jgi:hypothetical protein